VSVSAKWLGRCDYFHNVGKYLQFIPSDYK
jgi:hypothetical protein